MDRENDFRDLGRELGHEGVEQLVAQAAQVCAHRRRCIELTNEPQIVELRAELALWADEDKRLSERLRLAPPAGDRRSRRRKAYIAGAVALALAIAGFFLALLALAPFRFGPKAYLLCIGMALVCPYGVEKLLEEWDGRKLIKTLATISCITAIASLVLLAEIRGKLFAQELADTQSEVLIDGASSDAPRSGIRFYEEAVPLLQLMMAFLAIAMELGAGLAFHDAKRLGIDSGEDSKQVADQRTAVRRTMASLFERIRERENEAVAFEAHFWGSFYRAMITHTARKGAGKFLVFCLCCAFFGASTVRAAEVRFDLVVLVDLSASVATKGPDGKTDFQKNVAAVTALLREVPAATQITVVGITGKSFEEPDILLSARVAEDSGYFGERLAAAHRQLVRAWQTRAARLTPNARRTDILGALLVASQILATSSNATRKILVIYSDMRQETPELSLGPLDSISTNRTLAECARKSLIPRLQGVNTYSLGVDAVGMDAARWNGLRRFWYAYFRAARATLRTYSTLRSAPTAPWFDTPAHTALSESR